MPDKKYLIAIPCMDNMPTPFVASLFGLQRVGLTKCSFLCNSLVYDARNMLAAEAIDTGADRVLWLDSDMRFTPDLMQRLADDMDSGLDYVCGIYVKRRLPTSPCIYEAVSDKCGKVYADYPRDQVFEIDGSGFGAVMTSTRLLKAVFDEFGRPFNPIPGVLGEDLAFCWRAKQLGYEMYCDSRIKVDHMGYIPYSEAHYLGQTAR